MLRTSVIIFCFVTYCYSLWSKTPKSNNIMEKQLILDLHNWYRAQVSRGEVYHQPEAADMTVVEWDDRLADIAQSQAQYCRFDINVAKGQPADQPTTLQNEIFGELSINEFFTNRTDNYFYLAISSWFKSHVNFSYATGACNGSNCQQYKNMIFSNSFILGCDSQQCTNGISVVCVYANSEKNNLKNRLYKKGLSCTSCPQDFSHCMDGSLCASKFHCHNSRISKTCRCLVLREVCFKHGDFDSNKCRCRCQPGWTGLHCERKCEDISPKCHDRKWACTDPMQKNFMLKSCQATCKWCQNNPNSVPIFNEEKLKINTIYDPSNFELFSQDDVGCKDSKLECAAWAANGFCDKESVRRVCQLTCNVCGEIEKVTSQMRGCLDHPTCVSDFAPYCNTMLQIYTKCPKLCGRCTTPSTSQSRSTSTIRESTTSLQSTRLIERKSNEDDFCSETLERQETCNSIHMANLCSKEDMNELCPITCKHPLCKKVTSTTTRKLSTSNPAVPSTTGDSEVCKFLPCSSPGIMNFCKIKCGGFTLKANSFLDYDGPSYCNVYPCSIPFVNKVCKKCDDPEICITLDCGYNGVPKLCQKKCKSVMSRPTPAMPSTQTTMPTTTISSTTLKPSTILASDLPVCNWLPCASQNIMRICPRKCASSTSTILRTKPTDPALCAFIPCSMAQSELACPTKCASSTTLSSTLTSSTVPADPSFCLTLPCNIPQVKSVCPIKCSLSSTISTTTEPTDDPICSFLPCSQPQVRLACPNKCASDPSEMVSSSPSSTPLETTPLTTDPAGPYICGTFSCSMPFINSICPNKCGSTTPKVSPTLTIATKQTDHPLCAIWSCSFVAIGSLCPNKCFSSTLVSTRSTTAKPTDPPFCSSFPCYFPQVKAVCPLKCGIATTGTTVASTSAVTTTLFPETSKQQTDFPMCIFVICDSEDARMACPTKCGSTTSKSSTTLYQTSANPTKPTDFPMCIFVICDSEDAEMACPIKCGGYKNLLASTTTISKGSTTMKPTDPPFCDEFPCELSQVKMMCPLKCGPTTPKRTTASSSTIKTSSLASSTLLPKAIATDDPFCAQLPCSNPRVRDMCKNKCGNLISMDNPLCDSLPCSKQEVRELCPLKCGSTTSRLITSTTTTSIDPPFCTDFPCEFPQIKIACPLKCGFITSRVTKTSSSIKTSSTTSRPITSATTIPSDPPFCADFPCEFLQIRIACPLKCASLESTTSSTTEATTDDSICAQLPCSIPGVRDMCKNKCVDNPICESLPCSNQRNRELCPLKCGSSTSRSITSSITSRSITKTSSPTSQDTTTSSPIMTSSTTSRPISSTLIESIDPPFCADFPCEFPQVKKACPLMCGSTSTRESASPSSPMTSSKTSRPVAYTSTTPIDPPFCDDFTCEFPQIKIACPLKCGIARTREPTTPSYTVTKLMKNNFSGLPRVPSIEKMRRTRSGSSTSNMNPSTMKSTYISTVITSTFPTKSSTSSAKRPTDPSFCLIFSCNITGMTYACPNKCGLSTTSYIA